MIRAAGCPVQTSLAERWTVHATIFAGGGNAGRSRAHSTQRCSVEPVRVARVRLQRFRGFLAAEILPDQHVAVVGEPRAGRTDLLTGLRRVLDPTSTAARLDPLDVHRPLPTLEAGEERPLTEVEVTLVDLGSALEQAESHEREAAADRPHGRAPCPCP